MSLLESQKAERRARILDEARTLMGRRGWAGLTMRDLAKASRVSVPTVYNLVGGKDAILSALMEDLFAKVSEEALSADGDLVSRATTLWRAGPRPFMEAPAYSRELMMLFISSPGTGALRREHDDRYAQLMANVLAAGQRKGEISRLVSANDLARTMYSLWIAQAIRWAHGDLDDDSFRAAVDRGLSLLLLGVAEGETRDRLTCLLEELEEARVEPDHRAKGVA